VADKPSMDVEISRVGPICKVRFRGTAAHDKGGVIFCTNHATNGIGCTLLLRKRDRRASIKARGLSKTAHYVHALNRLAAGALH